MKLIINTCVCNLLILLSSCSYFSRNNEDAIPSFEKVKGIKYSEVHRRYSNGLSIDNSGFHLRPEWDVYFTGNDTIKIFEKDEKKYNSYRIFHSHKDLFHFARNWYRVKHLSKDSIVLQALKVESRVVNEEESTVFSTLYSEDYMENKLHSTPEMLRKPGRGDSLFVRNKARTVNLNPNIKFAARNPVDFKSKSKLIKVRKIEPDPDPYFGDVTNSEAYMKPVYVVHIDSAYRDFKYSLSLLVDHRGKMKFRNFLFGLFPEFIETKTKVAHGIVDVYLTHLLEVTPGNTLGYPHATIVDVHVVGKK